MKILHIITSLRTGGAERLVTDMLPRLRSEGDDVSVLLFDGTQTPCSDELAAEGIRVFSLSRGCSAMRNPFLLFPLVRHLRKHGYDIVHTHNTSCQLLAAAASLFVPSVFVTTEHNTTNRRRGWKWYRFMDRWMYGRYARIICVGDDTEKALVSSHPSVEGKTVVIRNGIDQARVENAVPAADIAGIEGHRILMVAAFRAQKDHATLIRAMQSLPGTYTLLLAGGAETREDEKTLQECQLQVERLGLKDRVRFLGVRQDVPSLMAAADVLVLSSHYEGGPLSAIEAMASGRPVIASDVPGLSGIVGGAGLMFPCGDSDRLAALIRSVCEDTDEAVKVADACRLRSLEYGIDRTVRSYRDIYKQLFNHKSICASI